MCQNELDCAQELCCIVYCNHLNYDFCYKNFMSSKNVLVTLLTNGFTILTINLCHRQQYTPSGTDVIVVVFDNKMASQVV